MLLEQRPEHQPSSPNQGEQNQLHLSEIQRGEALSAAEPKRGLSYLVGYIDWVFICGFPTNLYGESKKIDEQIAAVRRGEITDSEKVQAIEQRLHDLNINLHNHLYPQF